MKFYVVADASGSVLGCELSLRAAITEGRTHGVSFVVSRVVLSNSRETLRRMLGGIGGYADEWEEVYRESAADAARRSVSAEVKP